MARPVSQSLPISSMPVIEISRSSAHLPYEEDLDNKYSIQEGVEKAKSKGRRATEKAITWILEHIITREVFDELIGENNQEVWEKYRDGMVNRVSNFNTSSGLALATVAAFLTTTTTTDVADWNATVTYMFIAFTMTLAVISSTAGTCLIYLLGDIRASDLRVTETTDRKTIQKRFVWVGILLVTQAAALLMIAFSATGAFLAAVWIRGKNRYAQVWVILFTLIQFFIVFCLAVGKVVIMRARARAQSAK